MSERNSVDSTYYQRNRDVKLNTAKDYYENGLERLREQARHKYRNLSEEEKIKRENMEETDIIICLKKRNKNEKNIKKIIARLKSQSNQENSFFNYDLIMYAVI